MIVVVRVEILLTLIDILNTPNSHIIQFFDKEKLIIKLLIITYYLLDIYIDMNFTLTKGSLYVEYDKEYIHHFLLSNNLFSEDELKNMTNREKRDGSKYHITVINIIDMKTIDKVKLEKINDYYDSVVKMVGIGKINTSESSAVYIVCMSDKLQLLRKELGLAPCDFHITLDFTNGDIYDMPKSLDTIRNVNLMLLGKLLNNVNLDSNADCDIINWILKNNYINSDISCKLEKILNGNIKK